MAPSDAGRVRRALRHPLLLFPVKVVLVVAPMIATLRFARFGLHWSHDMVDLVAGPIAAIILLALFTLYTRAIERRAVTELSAQRAPRELIAGFIGGLLCMSVVFGVLLATHVYHVTGVGASSVLWVALVSSLVTGVFEELLFRGVLFRLIEESWGSYVALAISSLFFGAAHLFNPNATVLSAVSIVVEAGIFLGAAYMLTRRLWLPIGIHAGWNFTEGGVFGAAESGVAPHGWLQSTTSGPAWLSGGEFGPEGSVVTVAICGAIGIALVLWVAKHGGIIRPRSRRAPAAAGGATTSV
jgi:membrane protease YdiL (CAAX protease family)